MNCAACQHENPDGSAFCEECGARFERRCPACGSVCAPTGEVLPQLRDRARCARGRARRRRRGAQGRHHRLRRPDRLDVAARTARPGVGQPRDGRATTGPCAPPVEAHGGTVVQLLGDGVMCAFGVPRVAEDDAIRAVRAAVGDRSRRSAELAPPTHDALAGNRRPASRGQHRRGGRQRRQRRRHRRSAQRRGPPAAGSARRRRADRRVDRAAWCASW